MPAHLTPLLTCLQKEIALVEAFLDILRHEATVLEAGAEEAALADTTARKNELADALMQAARQRNELLMAMGCDADSAGLTDAASRHPEIVPLRDTLLHLTDTARTQNETNGLVIERFLQHNQRALEALRRVASSGEIYDASGRTRPGGKGGSRNIKAG